MTIAGNAIDRFKVVSQEHSNWCWAAVAASIDTFLDNRSTATQRYIAGAACRSEKGQPMRCKEDGKACEGKALATCDRTYFLHTVLAELGWLRGEPIRKPLSFEELAGEIDAGRPVAALIKWKENDGKPGNSGHFITFKGYIVTNAGVRYVSVDDPLFEDTDVPYDVLSDPQHGYRDGRGVWFASFLVNEKRASARTRRI